MPWVLDSGSFKYIKVRLWQFVENSVENLFNKTQSPDGRTCSFEIIRQKLSNKFVGAMLAGQAHKAGLAGREFHAFFLLFS